MVCWGRRMPGKRST